VRAANLRSYASGDAPGDECAAYLVTFRSADTVAPRVAEALAPRVAGFVTPRVTGPVGTDMS
jgi:hypothetical protein